MTLLRRAAADRCAGCDAVGMWWDSHFPIPLCDACRVADDYEYAYFVSRYVARQCSEREEAHNVEEIGDDSGGLYLGWRGDS